MKKQDYQQAHKWMTLSLSYLHLSIDPKKAEMDEKFEAELDQFAKEIEEAKKQRKSSQYRQNASATTPSKPIEEVTAENKTEEPKA